MSYEVYDDETRAFLATLTDDDRAAVDQWVAHHEEPLEWDCSDGPTVCLDHPATVAAMEAANHSCCGWEETRLDVAGRRLVVGSCYGH